MIEWFKSLFRIKSNKTKACRLCGELTDEHVSYCAECSRALSSANYYIKKNGNVVSKNIPLQSKIIMYAYNGKNRKYFIHKYHMWFAQAS